MSYPVTSTKAAPGLNLKVFEGNTATCPSEPDYSLTATLPPNAHSHPGEYPATSPVTHQPQFGAVMQPGADGWMPIPTEIPVCPKGLEYLTRIDQLFVHQKIELLELSCSCEIKNKYTVKNNLGLKMYSAKEDTNCCIRNFCGSTRPFDIKIKDNFGNEVIRLNRGLRCDSCCCPCCLQLLEVSAPPGQLVGRVVQEWSILTPQFRIENASGETMFKIQGPFCTFSICGDVEFEVLSTNGVKVGKISKHWSGLWTEAFTDADHFGITFPIDLNVRTKVTLLGALFLIDYIYFEKIGDEEHDGCLSLC